MRQNLRRLAPPTLLGFALLGLLAPGCGGNGSKMYRSAVKCSSKDNLPRAPP